MENKKIRENIKKGILGCCKDIENHIEEILDRLMNTCMSAHIDIIIEPQTVIRYEECYLHHSGKQYLAVDGRLEKKKKNKTNKEGKYVQVKFQRKRGV